MAARRKTQRTADAPPPPLAPTAAATIPPGTYTGAELAKRVELALQDFGTVEGALESALIDEVTRREQLVKEVTDASARIHDLKLRIRILQAIER